jgi:hypothetical protein
MAAGGLGVGRQDLGPVAAAGHHLDDGLLRLQAPEGERLDRVAAPSRALLTAARSGLATAAASLASAAGAGGGEDDTAAEAAAARRSMGGFSGLLRRT